MKKLVAFTCAAVLLAACNSAEEKKETTTADQPAADEWTRLFNGTSTSGWHSYGGGAPAAAWKVADSVLYLDTTGRQAGGHGGDLVSDEEFENFRLKLEWKISPGGNSGIIFYTHEDTAKYKSTWETGPEMQIVDNDGHPDGKFHKHRAGDLYDLMELSKSAVNAVGQWNQVEIRSLDGKLDLFLNGENVVSVMMWDEFWKLLIAGSKFKDMPGFGVFKKGHIVLQDHGNAVWFRNIVIKKL
jgi:hypothetical protein